MNKNYRMRGEAQYLSEIHHHLQKHVNKSKTHMFFVKNKSDERGNTVLVSMGTQHIVFSKNLGMASPGVENVGGLPSLMMLMKSFVVLGF